MHEREIEQRLEALNEALERLEQTPGRTAESALDAVEGLAAVYGEALRRIMDRVAGTPGLAASLAQDELVGHLLALHDIHPAPLEERLDRALEEVRPYVHSHGGQVELVGVEDGVARVRFSGTCDGCTASSTTLETGIRDALLAAAPEVTEIVSEDGGADPHPPPVIPVDSLRRPAPAGGRT